MAKTTAKSKMTCSKCGKTEYVPVNPETGKPLKANKWYSYVPRGGLFYKTACGGCK